MKNILDKNFELHSVIDNGYHYIYKIGENTRYRSYLDYIPITESIGIAKAFVFDSSKNTDTQTPFISSKDIWEIKNIEELNNLLSDFIEFLEKQGIEGMIIKLACDE